MVMHIKKIHQNVQEIVYVCPDCTFEGGTSRSVGTHRRNCKGPEVEDDKGFKCKECGRGFDTLAGVQAHRAKKHKAEYNSEQPVKRSTLWGDAEIADLAKLEIRLRKSGCKTINQELCRLRHNDRSVQSIATIRKKDRYKAALNKAETELQEGAQDERVPETNGEIPSKSVTPAAFEALLNEMEKDSDIREFLTASSKGNGDRAWTRLKRTWKERYGRKVKVVRRDHKALDDIPRNRNQRRAKWFQRTQKALRKNKYGTLKDIIKGTFDHTSEAMPEERPSTIALETVFRARLAGESIPNLRAEHGANEVHMDLITPAEVDNALCSMKEKTAAGVEQWLTVKVLKKVGSHASAAANGGTVL